MELEFIVSTEKNKGKPSKRAVHLKVLPKGTLSFEETLAGT
jgi:hypothetical protein